MSGTDHSEDTAYSRRHHYIPEFHLKGFTDADGMLCVYDKVNKRVKHGRYSPKSHFFEPDRNTVRIASVRPDQIERYYAEFDQTCSRVFERLRGQPPPVIDLRMIQDLKLYVSMLFWRIPASDGLLSEFLAGPDLKALGLQLTAAGTNEPIAWPEFAEAPPE